MDKIGILLMIASGVTNAVANSFLKKAFAGNLNILAGGLVKGMINVITNPFAVIGAAVFGISFLLFAAALGRINLSMAYPFMSGTAFLLIFLISLLFFKEQITLWGAIGAFSILFGIILISVKG